MKSFRCLCAVLFLASLAAAGCSSSTSSSAPAATGAGRAEKVKHGGTAPVERDVAPPGK